MSGIEFAGLFLSAVPLVPAALDGVHDLSELRRMWFQYERLSKRAERRLKRVTLRYLTLRTNVFQDLAETEEEKHHWITGEIRSDWDTMIGELEKRSPWQYWNTFLNLMEDFEGALQKLARRLKLDQEVKDGKSGSKGDMARRIHFCSDEKHREKNFVDVERLMNDLERASPVTGGSSFSTAYRKPTALDPALRRSMRRSHTFHSHLVQMETWRCDCHSSHCIDLVLHDRVTADGEPHFWVHFAHNMPIDRKRPWSAVKTRVRELRRQHHWKSSETPRREPPSSSERTTTVEKLKPILKSFPRRRTDSAIVTTEQIDLPTNGHGHVVFDDSSRSSSNTSVKTSIASNDTLVAFSDKVTVTSDVTHRENIGLCHKIATGKSGDCVHKLAETPNFDPLQQESLEDTHSLEIDHTTEHMQTMSLAEALLLGSLVGLDRKHCLLIAYKLTSWHIPEHPESWLNYPWSKSDINFPALDGKPDLTQPLIRRRCGIERSDTSAIPNKSLVKLGILLLELCFGMALEQHPIRKEFPVHADISRAIVDWAAAKQLAELVEATLGLGYSKAVKWCLNYDAGTAKDIGKVFEHEVVLPLKCSYEFWIGKLSE